MLRYIACLIGLLAIITAPSVYGQSIRETGGSGAGLVTVLLLCFVTLVLIGVIVWQWNKTPQAKDDDKALEGLRIIYGFWLIVVALLVALLVLFVTLTTIRISPDVKTTDIVAIIGTVTGLITTLVAAFFGIQQAGAGRSQAMTALAQLRGPGPDGAGVSKLEPAHGPHSGGTKVSITGNGFTGASAVNFGRPQGQTSSLKMTG
jgi:IPT/TIG domain